MRATILYGSLTYQEANGIKTQSRDCLHVDPVGNKYNLTSLRNTNETARFTITYRGYKYSFNPCESFKIGKPFRGNECHSDVAICRWVEEQMYHNIGHQSTEKCLLDKDTKTPMLEYTGDIYTKTSHVLLKCNKTEERPSFKALSVDYPQLFVFSLTHKCACPNLCLYKHITPPKQPGPNDNNVVSVVAGSLGSLVFVACIVMVIFLIVRRMNRPNPQNRGEDQPILPDPATINRFSSINEDSESLGSERLGRNSPSGTFLDYSQFENEITESQEDPPDGKNKSCAENRC